MKKIMLLTVILLGLGLSSQVTANPFPKCEAACNKYYSCVVATNPGATEDQKQLIKKGCELNCNKTKYYASIASCYDKSGGTCQSYWSCITSAMKK
jgi:Cys-rich protein (TIGR04453 family)